jgi:hypothetical protein
MPALHDYIDDLFDTYFYHVTTPQKWEEIRKEGLRSGQDGTIQVITTDNPAIIDAVARNHMGMTEYVVIRFCPCDLGLYPVKLEPPRDSSSESHMTTVRTSVIDPLVLELVTKRMQG